MGLCISATEQKSIELAQPSVCEVRIDAYVWEKSVVRLTLGATVQQTQKKISTFLYFVLIWSLLAALCWQMALLERFEMCIT